MTTTENYIRDTFSFIVERALEAKVRKETAEAEGDKESAMFEAGRAAGYYEVVSTIFGQLESFGLPRGQFGLPDGFEVDRDLL